MKAKMMLAGSASLCALALALGSTAALAQGTYGGNGPQYSTPQEQEQTQRLNQEAVSGTTESPQVLNGEAQTDGGVPQQTGYGNPSSGNGYAGAPQDQVGYPDRANANGGAADPQQQQYQQQLQQYGAQQDEYQRARTQYHANLRAYDLAMYDWAYPAPIAYNYGAGGLQPLYLIAEPSQQLFQIPVEGPGGRWVGRVRNIETAPDGRPARVEIALNRRVSVWVSPGDLRYDSFDHVLLTDLSRAELWQMPGATVQSGPM